MNSEDYRTFSFFRHVTFPILDWHIAPAYGSGNYLWRAMSTAVVLIATPWLVWDVIRVRRLPESERSDVNPYELASFNSLAAMLLILQVGNALALAKAWPLFLAIVLTIAGAPQQFILLARMEFHEKR